MTVVDYIADWDAFVIIACDGIFDVMSDMEAVALVMEGWGYMMNAMPDHTTDQTQTGLLMEVLARMLIEEALQRGSTDNCSAQVVLL